MINNRQNGRRRGRGGGGPRSPNQSPSVGNRQDNRSRGNAAQLLEKYKSLARDAQLQGDRVQSEWYLQFAEHYYRVLNETRARFEEQRPRRDDYGSDEDEDQDEGMAADGDDGDEDGDDRHIREDRGNRDDRGNRSDQGYRTERSDRNERPERTERPERSDRNERPERTEQAERPRREFQPREERNGERRPERFRARRDRDEPRAEAQGEADERTISLDVLPPAISVVEGDAPAKPVRARRTRRPRAEDGDTEIAPAA
ncbi:MAG: hypothetical protein QOG72_596 [Sphingomonadales bacterium]|nr:hypothetical protein [Sphingomonadales bacterium]